MDRAGINVLRDPAEDAQALINITASKRPCHVNTELLVSAPVNCGSSQLAWAILRALGKSARYQSRPRNAWDLVETWLDAEGVHRLFITDAQRVSSKALSRIHERIRSRLSFGQHFPDVWMIDTSRGQDWSPPPELDSKVWQLEGFELRQREIAKAPGEDQPPKSDENVDPWAQKLGSDWPPVMRDSLPVSFLAVAESELQSEVYSEVANDFEMTRRMFQEPTSEYLSNFNSQYTPSDEDTLLRRLRFALSTAESELRGLVRIKAAQVEAFTQGLYLRSPPVVEAIKSAKPPPGSHRLREFPEPKDALIGLLALSTGLGVSDLEEVNYSCVGTRFGGMNVAVPDGCEPIIRIATSGLGLDSSYSIRRLISDELPRGRRYRHPVQLHYELVKINDSTRLPVLDSGWAQRNGFELIRIGRQ